MPPAALAIAPTHGGIAAKSATASPVGVAEDAFAQVMRTVQAAVTDQAAPTPTPPAATTVIAEPVVDPRNALAETPPEPPDAQVGPSPEQPIMATDPAPEAKPIYVRKNDHHADAPPVTASSIPGPVSALPGSTAAETPAATAVPAPPVATTPAPPDGLTPPVLLSAAGQTLAAPDQNVALSPPQHPIPNDGATSAAVDPGGPSQLTQAVALPQIANNPTPVLAPPRMRFEVPSTPAPDAADSASPVVDSKNGLRATEAVAEPALRMTRADTPLELGASAVSLSLPPTETVSTVAAPAHPNSSASPVAQVAPALLTLTKTADGNEQITVRLHPAELGMVQIRIERALPGSSQVEITVEKADTLQALQRDQPQLHRALDEAGIPASGRTVTFHIAQPAQSSAGSNDSGQGGSQQISAGRTNSGNLDTGGSPGGGKGSYTARETNTWSGAKRQSSKPAAAGAAPAMTAQSYRIGLDITA